MLTITDSFQLKKKEKELLMKKVLPAFITGIAVTLGVQKTKDYFDNYKYPLTGYRDVVSTLPIYDEDKDDVLSSKEAKKFVLQEFVNQDGKFDYERLNALIRLRGLLKENLSGIHKVVVPSNIQTTIDNLAEAQDEVLKEQTLLSKTGS